MPLAKFLQNKSMQFVNVQRKSTKARVFDKKENDTLIRGCCVRRPFLGADSIKYTSSHTLATLACDSGIRLKILDYVCVTPQTS